MATPLHLPFRRKATDDKSAASDVPANRAEIPEDIQRIVGMLERLPISERGRIEQVVSMTSNQRQEAIKRLESSTDSLRRTVLGDIPAADSIHAPDVNELSVDSTGWSRISKVSSNDTPIKKFAKAATRNNAMAEPIDAMYVARRLSVTSVRTSIQILFKESDTGQVVRTEYELPYNDSIKSNHRTRNATFSFVGPERQVFRVNVNLIFQPGERGRAKLEAHVVRSIEAIQR